MEDLILKAQQLKKEAAALHTILEREQKDETRATQIAKLYTIAFDYTLCADYHSFNAFGNILTIKASIEVIPELADFMNSGEADSPSHWLPFQPGPYVVAGYPTEQHPIRRGPVFAGVFSQSKEWLENETRKMYGGQALQQKFAEILNQYPKKAVESKTINEDVLHQQCDKIKDWIEKGKNWKLTIEEGDKKAAGMIDDRFPKIKSPFFQSRMMNDLADELLDSTRSLLEDEVKLVRGGHDLVLELVDNRRSRPRSPQIRAMMDTIEMAFIIVEKHKDLVYHMAELAIRLEESGALEYLKTALQRE